MDEQSKRGRGKERRETRPFVEIRGRQYVFYRQPPEDLKKALGIESWIVRFPITVEEATVDDLAQKLAEETDRIIAEKRLKLKAIAEHNARTRASKPGRAA